MILRSLRSALLLWPCVLAAVDLPMELSKRAGALAGAEQWAVAGAPGWWFLTRELRSYGQGALPYDPLPAILDADRQIRAAGAKLLLVPVPGKVALAPEHLAPEFAGARCDAVHRAFYARAVAAGIAVLDLTDDLSALRAAGTEPHCRQDSHWSPAAMRLAAERIAAQLALPAGDAVYVASPTNVTATGDLPKRAGVENPTEESLQIETVRRSNGTAVGTDRSSSVLLIGDSHGLVFGSGLLAREAGLADHLALRLGRAIDNGANQGDGVNQTRAALARRGNALVGKQAVIWVFSSRALTETDGGWRIIPLQ